MEVMTVNLWLVSANNHGHTGLQAVAPGVHLDVVASAPPTQTHSLCSQGGAHHSTFPPGRILGSLCIYGPIKP